MSEVFAARQASFTQNFLEVFVEFNSSQLGWIFVYALPRFPSHSEIIFNWEEGEGTLIFYAKDPESPRLAFLNLCERKNFFGLLAMTLPHIVAFSLGLLVLC